MAKVTAKYQITIPKGIREEMGIFPGCDVEIRKEKGMYVLFADLKQDIRKKWRGKFKNGKTSDAYIEEIRGRAD